MFNPWLTQATFVPVISELCHVLKSICVTTMYVTLCCFARVHACGKRAEYPACMHACIIRTHILYAVHAAI